ncbi:MAG: DNA-processing protein DprA [Clostridia bacterium]|nr:DNA-processing protein DprA [Clostridia bacterium]
MNNLLYWVWLSEKCTPNTPIFSILYHHFGSIEKVYESTEEELKSIYGLTQAKIRSLLDKRTTRAQEILNECLKNNISILPYSEELFPTRIRTIKNPPVLLYYKGKLPEFDKELCIGTVGTRNPSPYGYRCAYEIAFDLAISGTYVISGMALGIDSVCHNAALDAGGKTVAVLGCGIDIVYPKENADLYNRLSANSTIISEYSPGTSATRYTFPQRNRIISGLSLGTLIVEAQQRSGAMITAQMAAEQNRDVFAIPGRVGELNSIGPNLLIRSGAKSVSHADDILREYEFLFPDKIKLLKKAEKPKKNPYAALNGNPNSVVKTKTSGYSSIADQNSENTHTETDHVTEESKEYLKNLPEEQKNICMCLSKIQPVTLEEIVNITGYSVSDTMSALTILEIQGIVNAVPGGGFLLAQ